MTGLISTKKVLVISPTPSHPQNAGNRVRICNLLQALKSEGYDVYFCFIETTDGDIETMQHCWGENRFHRLPYRRPETANKKPPKDFFKKLLVRAKGVMGSDPRYTYQIDDWYDSSLDPLLAKLAQQIQPDIVMVEYVFFSKALLNFSSSTLKVIDTHDVFTDRYKLYLKNQQSPRWFSTTRREEAIGLSRSNIVVAIQESEARFLSTLQKNITDHRPTWGPAPSTVTVGHLVDLNPLHDVLVEPSILYIGSKNPINIEGFNYFLHEILPNIREIVPTVKLLIAGDICEKVEDSPNCIKFGRVQDLTRLYRQAMVVINPVRFGTGLKIKSIEALGYAKPLVTTSVGAEGLESSVNQAFCVADTSIEFSQAVTRLLINAETNIKLSKNAFKFAEKWNKSYMNRLINALPQKKTS